MQRIYPGNTTAEENAEIEKQLDALKQLRKNFLAIQAQLNNDIVYRRECELLLEAKKNGQPFAVTPAFRVNIVDKFATACGKYAQIKKSVSRFVPEEEIRSIEESITKAANRQSDDAVLFFPTMQKIYNQGCSEYQKKHQPLLAPQALKAQAIESRYLNRFEGYKLWYCGAGFGSAIVIGLPFLLGGLLVHAIDKLITELRIHLIYAKNWEIQHNIAKKYNPELPLLNKRIQEDRCTGIRQRFFQAARARYEQPYGELENISFAAPKANNIKLT